MADTIGSTEIAPGEDATVELVKRDSNGDVIYRVGDTREGRYKLTRENAGTTITGP